MINENLSELGEEICKELWLKGSISSDYNISYHPTRLLITTDSRNVLGYVSIIENKRKWESVIPNFSSIRARELGIRLSLFYPNEPDNEIS